MQLIDIVSIATNNEDLKQSVNVAKQLQESIAAVNTLTEEGVIDTPQETALVEQTQLAHQLQNALSSLQIVAVDSGLELKSAVKKDDLQHLVNIVTQLNEDLAVVVKAKIPSVEILSQKAAEVLGDTKSAKTVESVTETASEIAKEEFTLIQELKTFTDSTESETADIAVALRSTDQIVQDIQLENGEEIDQKPIPRDEVFTDSITSEEKVMVASEVLPSKDIQDITVICAAKIEAAVPIAFEEVAFSDKEDAKGQIGFAGNLIF